jgi:hypothetical protein
MYKTHGINCQRFAQRSAYNLMLVVMMVSLSIQQNWLSIGVQLLDVVKNKSKSKFLWKDSKLHTYNYVMVHQHKIHAQVLAVLHGKSSDHDKAMSLMKIFLRIPGLNTAKAGFCCQLIGGLVGCMDSHNIKMYGLNPKDFIVDKKLTSAKGLANNVSKVEGYVKLCHEYGTENLWNSWCSHISTTSKKWHDGNHVSEVHYSYLTGEKL